jgi:hypothetical protein
VRAPRLSWKARRSLLRSFAPEGLFVVEIVIKGGRDLSRSL